MHHTRIVDNEGNEWQANHNGDFSGNVILTPPAVVFADEYGHDRTEDGKPGTQVVSEGYEGRPDLRIPYEVFEQLVCERERREAMSAIDSATTLAELRAAIR